MATKTWRVIGLMSGTSLDGVDLAYVKITLNRGYHFEIFKTKSVEYSELWKNKLNAAFSYSGEKLVKLDVDYGNYLGDLVCDFTADNGIEKLDFIASHGHTIFHDPDRGYTLQIGSGSHLSARTGKKVICDFRDQDVALGGQGAPLVPIGDQLLFSEYDLCLNLGGFANISYDNGPGRIAYDICPVNIVLNYYTRKIGLEFDDRGKLASGGRVNSRLLDRLNSLEFYKEDKPKSLGYEFLDKTILPLLEEFDLSMEDVLRTFVEHSAFQISKEINQIASVLNKEKATTLITGGGAYNDFLIKRIRELSTGDIVLPSREIIDYKEALIFALLGVLRDQGEVNCLKSVTGASKDHSSGVVYEV
jgi:anhydro-N-acetylmuramic acid kinase